MKKALLLTSYLRNVQHILLLGILILAAPTSFGQSPKKYFKNGMYEKAFVQAAYKQNKKVALKDKYTEIIYASYDIIYKQHGDLITSPETDWTTSFTRMIRLSNFRARVKHQGVYDNLKSPLLDTKLLDELGLKFEKANNQDLIKAADLEQKGKLEKALKLYEGIAKRHTEAERISTLKDRLKTIDYESLITDSKQRIGDQYMAEAGHVLGTTEQSAVAAIKLIEKARSFRPLSLEEEEFLTLVKLVKGESWIKEAEKLLETGTRTNARLAYELFQKARSVRSLTAREEQLSKDAQALGMTRVLVKTASQDGIHDATTLSGFMNKNKSSKWITYFDKADDQVKMDFEITITESKANSTVSPIKREVKQSSRDVEYWEDETDANGNTTQVKKTRKAIGVVAYLSRTKTARVEWSAVLKDLSTGSTTHSESTESRIEITNQYASLVSGDVLAMPQDTETDIDLDSQPFPSDKDLNNDVTALYLSDLKLLLSGWQIERINP